ncbi:hypothetical protein V5799_032412 [Amblyomma americanum]|uniref:Uncharacterized protein n=1 Tax=Amblyomma americanum TaxID=6943 RepID=A0AAQ4DR90_AMBAM
MSEWDFDCPKYVSLPRASDDEGDSSPESYFEDRKEDGVFRRMTRSMTAALGTVAVDAAQEALSSAAVKARSDASAVSTPAKATTSPLKENCHPEAEKPTHKQRVERLGKRRPLRVCNVDGSRCRPTLCKPAPPLSTKGPATVLTVKKPPTASAGRKPPTASAGRKPPTASAARKPPTASAARKPPTASAARKPPTASAARKPPTASAARKPPTASAGRKPPTASAGRKPPTASTGRKPPTASAGRKPPTASAARKPPTASAARKPPTASAARKPPTASMAKKPPTASMAKKPPTASTAKKPPTASTAKKPPTLLTMKKPAAASREKSATLSAARKPAASSEIRKPGRAPAAMCQSLAELVGNFHTKTPTRFRKVFKAEGGQCRNMEPRKPTIPVTPKLATRLRSRAVRARDQDEHVSAYASKPKRPKLTDAQVKPWVAVWPKSDPASSTVKPECGSLVSKPLMEVLSTKSVKTPCEKLKKVLRITVPKSPAFALKVRSETWKQRKEKNVLDLVEPQKFRALPAPDPKRVFRPRNLSVPATKPRPFRLASVERHEKCQEEFRRKTKQLEAERVKMAQFVAKPVPAFLKARRNSINEAKPGTLGHVSRPRRR